MSSQPDDGNPSRQDKSSRENESLSNRRERLNSDNPLPQELIQHIPEEIRSEIMSILLYREQYSGPIAHPKIGEGWERILPGSADRILSLTEQQQQHRFEMEKRGQKAAILRERVGIVLGFVLGIALLALSAYAIAWGVALASVAIVGSSIVSLAGVYIYSSQTSKKELQEKRRALNQPSVAPRLPDGNQKEPSDPAL